MALLRQVNLNGTNANDAIVPYDAQYLVKVCGRWRAGAFDRQWYGLNFTNYGSEGIELEAIDEVYEIIDARSVGDEALGLPAEYLQSV
jgi:hypothetical protein